MRRTPIVPLMIGFALVAALPQVTEAKVVRFVVEQRAPFAEGAAFGETGAYERLTGTAYFEVDPNDPLNAVIVDLSLAPRNARGRVEFSAPFFILKPVDLSRGNHKIFYTANNRGNDALLNAKTKADVGLNDFPLRMGYTLVDAGWQGDIVATATKLVANLPIATQPDGSAIVGRMRVEYNDRNMKRDGAFTLNLEGDPAFRSYETADTNPAHSTLTVRDAVDGPRIPISPDRWSFGRCPEGRGSLTRSAFDICLFDGFRLDKLYELIYPAKNPIVMGLGFATTRDVASFLRYDLRDEAGSLNPLAAGGANAIRRVYATGASQTAGYLRDLVYQGFNEDESHRRVFDGIIPTIAGTIRVFINVRFADPNVYADQDVTHDYLLSSYPPFTYAVTTDPISGIRDGLLKRPATDPLVLHIDSATEFWQLYASLNVIDAAGQAVPIPQNVRLYFNSSTGHGFTTSGLLTPPPGRLARCANPTPTATGEVMRAMLVAMDAWADRGIEPPPSTYPRIEDGTLVPLADAARAFPDIPGSKATSLVNEMDQLNFGPTFGPTGGVITLQPPQVGQRYPILVPKPDADGLDIAGIRSMQIRVPLGTSTGWNVRAAGHREPTLCGLTGSFIPFAKTRAERTANGDPRRSLEERYTDANGLVRAVERATRELVERRFLLQEDADRFVAAAKASDAMQPAGTAPQNR
jgi:alpha/beta hydrolase family protein